MILPECVQFSGKRAQAKATDVAARRLRGN